MTLILTVAFIGVLVYVLTSSCLFGNHNYVIVERDDESDCHKLQCASCGQKTTYDPYEGICG
jgi:hypothetical protein